MRPNIENYWQAIQHRVCVRCIDRDSLGNCLLNKGDICALRTQLSQIIESVLSVQGAGLDPYVAALRRHVCSECRNQSFDATCSQRRSLDCGLDRYFPLVIQAIEEVNCAFHPTTDTV